MLNFLGLGQNVDIRIELDDEEHRKQEECKTEDGHVYPLSIYYDGETVSGRVLIGMKRGSKLEHQGIRIDFLGVIEFFTDRGNRDEFITLSQDLARPGILSQPVSYPFEFLTVNKPYESYCGTHVRLRYFLRVTVQRRLTDLTKDREILVHSLTKPMEPDESIQMEVGIEDSLHIEFEYNKSKYHLRDVIVGKIYFLLVRVKIKNMEIQILKRETLGSGPNMFTDSETIAKYEIMDGAPVRGESIPIRLFLQSYSLSPTMRDVNRKFSVRYFLNLVLLDEEERRYYKQQEIILYRRPDRRRRPVAQCPSTELNNALEVNDVSSSTPSAKENTVQEPAKEVSDSLIKQVLSTPETPALNGSSNTPENITADGKVPESADENVDGLEIESSPETSRTSRSMHRYEPKKVRQDAPSVEQAEFEAARVLHSTFSTDSDVPQQQPPVPPVSEDSAVLQHVEDDDSTVK
ncbi:hypothetical protein CRM22_010557 [Opisthorchis felineus]|uniref:Arrestin C-terminal-like domain-containing protein n=1 Tax=Opisthorchis felineus TaxID=147828 RepID=A0A4S2L371_OPIFE|nr:hypothetical protein CRM22_010557 [Opisthorchis felineus]